MDKPIDWDKIGIAPIDDKNPEAEQDVKTVSEIRYSNTERRCLTERRLNNDRRKSIRFDIDRRTGNDRRVHGFNWSTTI